MKTKGLKNSKRINKLFKKGSEEYNLLDKVFKELNNDQRLSYLYAVSLIQTTLWYLFNRTVGIEKIHHFFISDYLINNNPNDISLHYIDITKYYLKKKNFIDYEKVEPGLIERLSKAYKRKFNDIEEYLQFYINKKTDDVTFSKIINFVEKGK